jgi:hypothetical protein
VGYLECGLRAWRHVGAYREPPRNMERSGGGDPDFIQNANEGRVPGMCRAQIGCARNVPWIGWFEGGSGALTVEA